MRLLESFREWRDGINDPEYREKVHTFRQACKRLESPDVELNDCINLFAFRTHDGFYGPKNKKLKDRWFTRISRFLSNSPDAEYEGRVTLMAQTLSTEDQVELMATLFNECPKEENQWVTSVFFTLVAYHRSNAQAETTFTDFYHAVSRSSLIPAGVISSALPEIIAERRQQEVSIPLTIHAHIQ